MTSCLQSASILLDPVPPIEQDLKSQPTWQHFPVFWLRLEFVIEQNFRLPPFAGSMFRGLLGWSLKEVCSAELYAYLFETHSDRPRQSDASRPFILLPPMDARDLVAGHRFNLELRLLGNGCDYLAEFVEALQLAGERGLGSQGARFQLLKILVREGQRQWVCFDQDLGWEQAYQPLPSALGGFEQVLPLAPACIRLLFETPTRLVGEGSPSHMPSFELVMRALYRRINALLETHGGQAPTLTLLEDLDELRQIEGHYNLQWIDWERKSNRQRRRHTMGGFVGVCDFWGSFKPEWLGLLSVGEVLHLGKATTFGMGSYRLQIPETV